MHWYCERFAIGMLQYQMGPCLAGLDVPVSAQKAN